MAILPYNILIKSPNNSIIIFYSFERAIVDNEIQTHKGKKIIVEKYFSLCFRHFKAQ